MIIFEFMIYLKKILQSSPKVSLQCEFFEIHHNSRWFFENILNTVKYLFSCLSVCLSAWECRKSKTYPPLNQTRTSDRSATKTQHITTIPSFIPHEGWQNSYLTSYRIVLRGSKALFTCFMESSRKSWRR
jgi:hypothetical protein